MRLFRCELVTHDFLCFASREKSKVHQTENLIMDTALSFALSNYSRWYNEDHVPKYEQDFEHLSFFSTPAHPITQGTLISPWEQIQGLTEVAHSYNAVTDRRMQVVGEGIFPSFGTYVKRGLFSRYEFFAFSLKECLPPGVITLGIWNCACRVHHMELTFQVCKGRVKPDHWISWGNFQAPIQFQAYILIPPRIVFTTGAETEGFYLLAHDNRGKEFRVVPHRKVIERCQTLFA
jgi:CRISPR type I-D-associated protein Csc1